MLRSTDRIVTSHAGALEQPEPLRPGMKAREDGQPYDEQAFEAELSRAVREVVRAQVEAGLDSVNDGEFGKQNFTSYVGTRISGYEPRESDPATESPLGGSIGREYDAFSAYYDRRRGSLYGRGTSASRTRPTCTGPLAYTGYSQLQREIENLMDVITAGQVRGSAALPRRTESTLDPKSTYASRPLARPWTGRLRPPASSTRRTPRISGRATMSRRRRSARYVQFAIGGQSTSWPLTKCARRRRATVRRHG